MVCVVVCVGVVCGGVVWCGEDGGWRDQGIFKNSLPARLCMYNVILYCIFKRLDEIEDWLIVCLVVRRSK